jgi:glycosyltransferase involved in cell wall biosynthesis
VLKYFVIAHAADTKLRLIVLGAFEDDLDPVSGQAREILKTHPAIIHIDWHDDVEYFMHLSHLLIHASYREGFPNTLLQAGAMNCPIICSAIEGSIDIVTHKETGLLFQPRNADDLCEKLKYALTHAEEVSKYAASLRMKIEKYFSQQYLHACLKEKYLELLNKN